VNLLTPFGARVGMPSEGIRPGWRSSTATGTLVAFGAIAGFVVAARAGRPLLVVVAVVAVILATALLRSPTLALVFLVGVEISNASDALRSPASPYLIALVFALGWALIAANDPDVRIGWSPMYWLVAGVILSQALSMLASQGNGVRLGPLVETLKDAVFFFSVVILCRATRRSDLVVRVLVAVLGVLAAVTIVQQYILHNSTTFGGFSNVPLVADLGGATPRHSGPYSDVNFWGRTLVLFLPLTLTLWASHRQHIVRWFWLAMGASIAGGIYLTGSRGAMLSMVPAVIVWFVVAGRRYRRLLGLVVIAMACVALLPGVSSRLSTLTQLTDHTLASETDPSLVTRVAAQEIAAAMFSDHPVSGVGMGNFTRIEPTYFGRAEIGVPSQAFAPHNLYLQLAAEQGIVGLAAWALFFGGALFLCVRSMLGSDDDAPERLLGAGIIAGLAAWASASVFLHVVDLRDLLVVVALATVLDLETRERNRLRTTTTPPVVSGPIAPKARGTLVVTSVATMTAVVVLASAMALLAVGKSTVSISERRYSAEINLQVRPTRAQASYTDAYHWDTVNRALLVPTYAAIIANKRFQSEAAAELRYTKASMRDVSVDVIGDPASAIITLSARSRSAAVPEPLADEVLSQANDYLHLVGTSYDLVKISSVRTHSVRVVQSEWLALFVILATGAVLAAVLAGRTAGRAARRSIDAYARAVVAG
jgi:O-antigen ligase